MSKSSHEHVRNIYIAWHYKIVSNPFVNVINTSMMFITACWCPPNSLVNAHPRSGGKDSTFSMEVCRHYGHEIVALANLFPADPSTDELDSYMYQTVGHHVIATYAQCCALPLFRRRIQGASRDQTLVYRDTQGDEVEDLAALLAYIQQQMPAVQAVASGAIASDYQRTRVERVCARLGLVSLAYLWHQPQLPLLHRMIEAPIDAVLIKIAAAGLIPGKHLGASLPRMLPQLLLLRQRFGCNVCGEGGEYETLTLDCPAFVCGRIVLDSWDSILVDDNAMAPVAFLHPTAFHFEEKRSTNSVDQSDSTTNCSANLRAPPLRQGVVIQVPDEFCAPMSTDATTANDDVLCSADPTALEPAHKAVIFHSFRGHRVATLTAAVDGAPAEDYVREADTRKALWEALCRIADALPEFHASWQDTLFVHLYLPNMRHFAAANAVYAQFFPAINPPARACVQLESTAGGPGVVVEVLVSIPPRDNAMSSAPTRRSSRKVLHVQSVSEWAPACIGPYAQALAFSGIVHFAGQIPLHPPTMEVISGDFLAQSNRCLQSCQAVGIAMRTDVPQSMLWCHVYVSTAGGLEAREAAAAALGAFLRGIHVDTPQVEDCCDKGCGESILEENESEDEDNREADNELDDYLKPPCLSPRQWEPLVTFIEVPQLPKG
jgi:diphthine-ammonia ligase